jgi:hypothetical protein
MIKFRPVLGYYKGTLAELTADLRIWAAGMPIIVTDVKQIRYGDGVNVFDDLPPIYEQDLKAADHIAALGATANLTAIPGVFADLAAARTAVETLRANTEARLDAIEAENDLLITKLIAAGVMKAS